MNAATKARTAALLLCATLATGALGGCGNSPSPDAPSSKADAASDAAPDAAQDVSGEEKALNIFTWDGYFPEDVMSDFTAQTGIKANYSNFESNEEMLTKLEAANAGDYDIIVVSDYMVEIMVKRGGLLAELDKSKIPNYANLDEAYISQFYDPDNLYTVPYGPGSPLLIYDPTTCPVKIEGYADLWDPQLKDSLALMDSSRVIIGITLKTLGEDFNSTDEAVLERAKEKLIELKPNIRTMSVNQLQEAVLSGEASVGFLFTSQVATAKTMNPDLEIVYPKEGLGFGIDTLAVPLNAPHKENAHAFLNFLLEGETAARVSTQIQYLCPNTAAQEFLPDEYLNNPAYAIPGDLLKNADFAKDVGEATALYDRIWTEFKQA